MSNSFRKAMFLLAFVVLSVCGIWLLMNKNHGKSESKSSMKKYETYFVEVSGYDTNPGTKFLPKLTIAGAIASADNGDTIRIGCGNFTEKLDIHKRVVIIGSGSDVNGTVIRSNLSEDEPIINLNITDSVKNHISIQDIRIVIPKNLKKNKAPSDEIDYVPNMNLENISIRRDI